MTRASLLAATILTLFSGWARADLIPQDVFACNNISNGSPCDSGAGICQDSSCSRADYANWDRDASASPPITSYTCKRCVPKSAGTGTGADTGTGAATSTTTNTATTTNTNTATATATNGGTDDKEDKDSSGCSVSGARVIAPWLLAGIFAACVSLLRRRPRR